MPDTPKPPKSAPRSGTSDRDLFGPEQLPALRVAAWELGWLLGRGYAEVSAGKLVGDRHGLNQRQRKAVRRCTAPEAVVAVRRAKAVPTLDGALLGRPVAVDGFNALITIEAALSGRVVLVGADGGYRDMASVHGTWRAVSETGAAITLAGEALARLGAGPVTWLLDRPVSNSGKLRGRLLETAAERGWGWTVALPPDPDPVLGASASAVASNDSWVVDSCAIWLDLPSAVIPRQLPEAWLVDLRLQPGPC